MTPGSEDAVRVHVVQRWVKAQRQAVLFAYAQFIREIEDRLPEHVGVLSQSLPIQPRRCKGVQTLENQLVTFPGLERFKWGLELQAVPPLPPFDPRALELITVVERVLNPPGCHQGLVHIPGDRNVDPGTVVVFL